MSRLFKNNRGQGIMEYLIITSLVGIICIGAVKNFGDSLKDRIGRTKSKILSELDPSIYDSKDQ